MSKISWYYHGSFWYSFVHGIYQSMVLPSDTITVFLFVCSLTWQHYTFKNILYCDCISWQHYGTLKYIMVMKFVWHGLYIVLNGISEINVQNTMVLPWYFLVLCCKCMVLLADTITILWYHHHNIFCKGKNFTYYFVNITNNNEEGKKCPVCFPLTVEMRSSLRLFSVQRI